ncbi:MAG TPA: DMT family transporter [Burkholderiaceae bacterium]|jgi:drug/metabolite transporter (DMT)-like permease|nr:DMT family transporter [Burkholderiaceae bacterium]
MAPLAFVLLWSTGFIVAKYAAPHAPPLTFLLYRFAGVIAILLPIVAVMQAPWPHGVKAWRDVAIVGVLLQAAYLAGVWVAIALGMPAGVSALLVGAQPLLTALLAFTIGERASRVQWAGLLIGFAGIALVLSDRLTLAGVAPLALIVNLVALAGITVGTLYQKKHVADIDLRTGSLIQFAASFVILLPFAIATESMVVDYTVDFWLALGWSIVALSLVAIMLLLVMIRRDRATEVTSLMYLTPPATAVMAWLLFDERLGAVAWAGVLVTMAGVALVLTRKQSGN